MVKKGIYLLPHLFEDILLKSDQTGWPIPYKFIKPCLSNRDVLLWTNVDIKTGILDADDLLDLSKSKLPLKQLYFVTDLMTNSMMEVLGKWSEDLEFLQILYRNKARSLHGIYQLLINLLSYWLSLIHENSYHLFSGHGGMKDKQRKR